MRTLWDYITYQVAIWASALEGFKDVVIYLLLF